MSYGFTDAYPHARVTLMTRNLLPQGAIAAALDKSLQENAPLFAQTEAQLLLPDDADRQLRSIEQRRLSLLLNDVLILSRGLFGQAREFLLYWTQIFELMNLKAILRGRIAGGDPARERLLDMGPFARLPVDALLRADSETEMIRILDGTPFANIAWQARRVVEQRHDVFFLDTAFDRIVYNGLAWRAARVPARDRRALQSLMSCVIDGTNLVWLLRYRFFYGLPPAEVYYLLIPAGHRFSSTQLKEFTGMQSIEEVLAHLPRPFSEWVSGATDADQVRAGIQVALRRTAYAALRHSPSPFVRAYAYLLLRERDLRQLGGLVTGKVLGIDRERMRQALRMAPPAAEAIHA